MVPGNCRHILCQTAIYTATAAPSAHANMNLKTGNRNESFLGEKRPSPSFRRAEQHGFSIPGPWKLLIHP